MGVTVSVECLKNVIVSDSSCCSQHDHEAFTGIRVTIGLKRYYFRPYSILLYKKGQITIRDIENSVSFKEADSNQTFTQIRSLIANCAACGCNAVPVLLTSPNNTINIKTLPTGVTEIETDLSNLASTDAGNRLGQGSDTLWYVPPVTWAIISGAQNVVNVGDFNNNVGYLTSVGWSDLTGAQNVIDLSGFNNDIGFITGVTWAQITGSQGGINLSLFNNDANFISVGDNISDLNNDLNFISVGDDISLLSNNAGYVDAAGAAAAAPIQTVTGTAVDNSDPANPVINRELPSSPDNGDLAQFNGTKWNPLTVAPGEITKNLGAGLVAVQHREALKAREPFRSAPINTYFQLKDIIAWDNADKNLPENTVLTNLDSGQAWLPFLGPGVISYSTTKNGAFRGDGATTQIWSSVLSWGLGSVGIEWSVRRTTMNISTGLILAAKDTSNFIIFERNMPTGVYTGGLASVLNWRLRSVVAGVGTVLGTIDNYLIYGGGNDDAMDSTSIKWIVKYGYRGRNSASRILIYLESNPSVRLEVDVTSLNSTYVTSSDIAFVGLCGESQGNVLTERIVIAQLKVI